MLRLLRFVAVAKPISFTSTVSLEERMAQAQAGDQVFYQALLQDISLLLRSFFLNRLSNHADLDDLIQEVLLSVHHARHTYDSSRPFRPWLFSIAKFRMYDFLRKHYKKQEKEEAFDEKMLNNAPEDVTNDGADNELLYKALDSLPDKQRKIIVFMKLEGYTAKEVAKKMDMTESAVKVSAHRSYKTLQKLMNNNGG